MCLISKWRFSKRAKQDIICYKVLRYYELPSLPESKKIFEYRAPFINNVVDISKPYKAKGFSLSSKLYQKDKGYIHTCGNMFLANTITISSKVIFKCIIPKGTRYHMNDSGSMYCSKKIIFLEKL